MKIIDAEEIGNPDETNVLLNGSAFTGILTERDGPHTTYFRTVVDGRNDGACFYRLDSGTLIEYGNYYGGLDRGPSYEWDEDGNLISETAGDSKITFTERRWNSSGKLISEVKPPSNLKQPHSNNKEEILSWLRIPPHPDAPGNDGHIEAVRTTDLDFKEKAEYSRAPYTGKSAAIKENRRTEVRTFIEGYEFGPYWVWSPEKKLIIQGVRCHPYGPVGPWHEWDEQGRLLRETIYDALGNKIIHRELDENCNIVRQERFDPTTFMIDPESGEQRPAPWL